MNSLGFRPLRYEDGTGPQGVGTPGMTHRNAIEYIKWIHVEGIENLPTTEWMDRDRFAEKMATWLDNPEDAIGYATRIQNLVEGGSSPEMLENLGVEGFVGRNYGDEQLSDRDIEINPLVDTGMGRRMLENLGRNYGDERLSDRDIEIRGIPVEQKYSYGGSVPHGTVAGELPRYGDMSVREEGESMRELAKRHKDQRWYNRMGGGLGSLRRRMA